MHQIRLHLKEINHPIYDDWIYNSIYSDSEICGNTGLPKGFLKTEVQDSGILEKYYTHRELHMIGLHAERYDFGDNVAYWTSFPTRLKSGFKITDLHRSRLIL